MTMHAMLQPMDRYCAGVLAMEWAGYGLRALLHQSWCESRMMGPSLFESVAEVLLLACCSMTTECGASARRRVVGWGTTRSQGLPTQLLPSPWCWQGDRIYSLFKSSQVAGAILVQ